jgi:hypothetical protein
MQISLGFIGSECLTGPTLPKRKNGCQDASKDRATLLFCANAAGDMINPGMLYHSRNPRALKGKNKNELPVYWQSNKKECVTRELCLDWFKNCFVHEVEKYLRLKKFSVKVMLIQNNEP